MIAGRQSGRWREALNPLRGLTMQRAVMMLEDGERGVYPDLQWTFRFIEKRDATLRGLISRRTAALLKLDWDIKVIDRFAGHPAAIEQQRALRDRYDRIQNLRDALEHLALAEFRGFSILEVDDLGSEIFFRPIWQWHWCREGIYGPWRFNPTAAQMSSGESIEGAPLIIREVARPIDEIGLICHLRKNLSAKDWDGFVESYGIPATFITLPPNIPPDQVKEFQAVAERMVADARGVLPHGSTVATPGSESRGVQPFGPHLDRQDAELVLAGTGGKLSMLTAPTGLGSGVAEEQSDAFDDIAAAEAILISEVFQRQFDRAYLRERFPDQPVMVYWQLAAREETDPGAILDDAGKAAVAGFVMDAADVSERTGYKLTLREIPSAPALPTPMLNKAPARRPRIEELRRRAWAEALSVRPQWLAPVAQLLDELITKTEDGTVTDEDLLRFAEEAARRMPELFDQLDVESLAVALERAMGTAAVIGAVEGAPT